VFFWDSLDYPSSASRLPQILLILIAGLSVGMFVEALYKQKEEEKEVKRTEINKKRVVIFLTMIILYIFLIDVLGYFLLTPIFVFLSLFYLKAVKLYNAIFISVGSTLFVYALFNVFLNIPLPKGVF